MKIKLLLVITGFLILAPVVMAEDATSSATASATPVSTSVPTSIDQQKSDYFYQLEKYRQAKQQFNLDQAEYQKLGTLATKDKLVESYKNVLLARATTFQTYLFPLQQLLYNTQGIDVADKQKALDQIKDAASRIHNHIQQIPNLSEEPQVSTEAQRFESQDLPTFLEASYRSLSLLAIGRIQSIADQIVVSSNDFQKEVVDIETDARQKGAFERGLKEVAALHKQASEALATAHLKFTAFDSTKKEDGFNPQAVYQSVTDSLSPAYTSLQHSLDYLLELDKSR